MKYELLEEGIQANSKIINRVLGNCKRCQEYDNKNARTSRFVETKKPGELIGMDTLEVANKQKILLAIDYFAREIFGRIIRFKRPSEIIKILEKIKESLKFDKVIFWKRIQKWLKENKMEFEYSTPYYHEGNAIRKVKGPLKIKRESVIKG